MSNIDRTIAVVGTGVIGASWTAHYLARGFTVVAADPAEGAEGRLRKWVDQFWPALEALGLENGADKANLRFTSSIADAVRDAELVQENGPERPEIKASILAEIESSLAPDALIATSSSGLLISDVQAGMQHPERMVLGHDNALMESLNGLYKTECIRTTVFHDGPYRTVADVEFATAGWVDWYNQRRLHGSLGMMTPAEFEDAHYAALNREPQPAYERQRTWGASPTRALRGRL